MSTLVEEMGVVVSTKEIAPAIMDLIIKAPRIAERAVPGQFVSIYCRDLSRLLPRPISIADAGGDMVRFVFRIAGAGTYEFSSLQRGDAIRLTGPAGNGYPEKEGPALLLGGGIGIPPLYYLTEKRNNENDTVILGYRDKNLFMLPEFSAAADTRVATEDGSFGVKGNVLDALKEVNKDFETIFACGPMPMLKAVFTYARENGKACFLSLEERMACGVGACLGCSIKGRDIRETATGVSDISGSAADGNDIKGKEKRLRVCKEGPVFDIKELQW